MDILTYPERLSSQMKRKIGQFHCQSGCARWASAPARASVPAQLTTGMKFKFKVSPFKDLQVHVLLFRPQPSQILEHASIQDCL
jgi:hypothetical protein